MQYSGSISHMTTVEVNTNWKNAYEYLTDPLKLGNWALGCWNTREASEREGLFMGTSLFDGATTWFHIESNRDLQIINYHIGNPSSLRPRISARVIPGPDYGNSEQFCRVSLSAWRDQEMSDERWHQLCVSHETEILLIKALIEREYE